MTYDSPVNLPVQVENAMLEHGLSRQNQALVVAVSGGVDSMVLLHCLHEVAGRHGWRLTVAHFNHQLRGRSSAADERLVRRSAASLGLAIVVDRADVRDFARGRKLSVEMAARTLRHAFLARTAKQTHASTIALAHHADDQVELFLLRLLRGSGPQGLAGMSRRSPSPANPRLRLVRPLLDLTKAALQQFAFDQKIPYRLDASNTEPDFLRNRIRNELIPLLRNKYQPGLERTILRTVDLLRAESDLVAEISKPGRKDSGPPFASLPIAIQRRRLQAQIISSGLSPEFDLVEHLRLRPGVPITISTRLFPAPAKILAPPSGMEVLSDSLGRVTVRSARRDVRGFRNDSTVLRIGSSKMSMQFGGLEVSLTANKWRKGERLPGHPQGKKTKRQNSLSHGELFDAERIGPEVVLRYWRPGDRYQPIGLGHNVKLQDCFTNLKVPARERPQRVVAATLEGDIFWVEGLRISERFKLTEQTTRVLLWRSCRA